jgi:thiamine transporter ThiT
MKKAKTVAFAALMAALANVMSLPPLAIPLQIGEFTSAVHFFQLAIFLCGILAGPWAGLVGGAVGGLYMSVTKIPFIVGGIAILGVSVGLFAKKVRPVFAGLLAWLVQAPYVLVTDYVWFTLFVGNSSAVAWAIVIPIMINLTLQAVICAILADIIIHYLKRAGISLQ